MTPLPRSVGFIHAIFHLRSMLLGPPSLDDLLHNAIEGANAHSSLSMPRQGVVAGKRISTQTRMGFRAGMDFGVALEVVASDEALLAVITAELPVTKMGLYMGFDILFAAESLVASFIYAAPFVVNRIRTLDKLCNVVQADIGLFD